MFFIYSIKIDDQKIELHDFCHTEEAITTLLDRAAKKFILREAGERRADSPYFDDTPDASITEDGYFLRHAEDPRQIDVYQRKTSIIPGRVWSSFDVSCKKVLYFAVAEAPFELSARCTAISVKPKPKKTIDVSFIPELKKILEARREKVDRQIMEQENARETHFLEEPENLEDSYVGGNPLEILRKRVENESN